MATKIDGALSHIKLSGFKSIKSADVEFNNLNVLIGANGCGKSNFISFLQMMSCYLRNVDGLSEFVGMNGGANSLMYFGTNTTQTIEAELTFSTKEGKKIYGVEFGAAIGDNLFFKDERISFEQKGQSTALTPAIPLGSGRQVSRLLQISEGNTEYSKYIETIRSIRNTMKSWCFYQFHNTSKDSSIRGAKYKEDSSYLRSDGGNLAAFLFMLQDRFPDEFIKIITIVKQIAPYINKIILEEDRYGPYIRLKWSEKMHGSYSLDASQMSDGTLRAFALVTLLMQPKKPPVICIDEPELGLHPEAILILADLIKIASEESQVIISTQSPKLVDCFEPEDIIVVDKDSSGTRFTRLDYEKYKVWFDEYSISEIWDTNIFGGRP
jgi:predicted ATPase